MNLRVIIYFFLAVVKNKFKLFINLFSSLIYETIINISFLWLPSLTISVFTPTAAGSIGRKDKSILVFLLLLLQLCLSVSELPSFVLFLLR